MKGPGRRLLPRGLYALCDDGVRPELPLEEKAQRLLEGGVRVLQLRLKRTPERRALDAAREICRLCAAQGAVCLINDRVDWCLACGADGAHVGDEDLPPAEARSALGPARLLGVTARDAGGAVRAFQAGADYVGVGPVFATSTKAVDAPLLGLAGLRVVVSQSPLPVVAISGIGLSNIAQVAAAGAHGAAVVSDLLLADDIAARARQLVNAFEKGAGLT